MIELTEKQIEALLEGLAPVGTLSSVILPEEKEDVEQLRDDIVKVVADALAQEDDTFLQLLADLQEQMTNGDEKTKIAIGRLMREAFRNCRIPGLILAVDEMQAFSLAMCGQVNTPELSDDARLELAFCVGLIWSLIILARNDFKSSEDVDEDDDELNVEEEFFDNMNNNNGNNNGNNNENNHGNNNNIIINEHHVNDENPVNNALVQYMNDAENLTTIHKLAIVSNTPGGKTKDILDGLWENNLAECDDELLWALSLWNGSHYSSTNPLLRESIWNGLGSLVDKMKELDKEELDKEESYRKSAIEYCIASIPSLMVITTDDVEAEELSWEITEATMLACANTLQIMIMTYATRQEMLLSILHAMSFQGFDLFSQDSVESFIQLMLHLIHKPVEWNDEEDITEEEWAEDNDLDLGFQGQSSVALALDILDNCCEADPISTFQFLFPIVKEMCLNNDDPMAQKTGYFALSAVVEKGIEAVAPLLDEIVAMALQSLQSPSAFTRHGACNLFGQMATDLQDIRFTDRFMQKVGPPLFKLLDDPNPRVQSHSISCFINFFAEIDEEVAQVYIEQLLAKLATIAQDPPTIYVQESVITAVAAVAMKAENFNQYYSHFMQPLVTVIQTADLEDYAKLRQRSWECAAVLVEVCSEEAKDDAILLLDLALSSPEWEGVKEGKADETSVEFLRSIFRLVFTTKGCYSVDVITDVLLEYIKRPPVASLLPEPNLRKESHVPIPLIPIVLDSKDVDGKGSALDAIMSFPHFNRLKELVVILLQLANNLLVTCFDDFLGRINQALNVFSERFDFEVFHLIASNPIMREPTEENMAWWANAVAIMDRKKFPKDELRTIQRLLLKYFENFVIVCVELFETLLEVQGDPVAFQELEAKSFAIVVDLDNIVGNFLKSEDDELVHAALLITSALLRFKDRVINEKMRAKCICLVANLIDACRPELVPVLPSYLEWITEGITSSDPATRQASVYCLGVLPPCEMLLRGVVDVRKICMDNLDHIRGVINDPRAQDDDASLWARDNSISAFVHIAVAYLDMEETIDEILSFLPFGGDVDESLLVFQALCDQVGKSIDSAERINLFLVGIQDTFEVSSFQDNSSWGTFKIASLLKKVLLSLPEEKHTQTMENTLNMLSDFIKDHIIYNDGDFEK
eukprot:m.22845 g.22845  ORF g.22845 m.22845 type:complete len:1153 (-) comp5486_c0_seq1:98-3556(-)